MTVRRNYGGDSHPDVAVNKDGGLLSNTNDKSSSSRTALKLAPCQSVPSMINSISRNIKLSPFLAIFWKVFFDCVKVLRSQCGIGANCWGQSPERSRLYWLYIFVYCRHPALILLNLLVPVYLKLEQCFIVDSVFSLDPKFNWEADKKNIVLRLPLQKPQFLVMSSLCFNCYNNKFSCYCYFLVLDVCSLCFTCLQRSWVNMIRAAENQLIWPLKIKWSSQLNKAFIEAEENAYKLN